MRIVVSSGGSLRITGKVIASNEDLCSYPTLEPTISSEPSALPSSVPTPLPSALPTPSPYPTNLPTAMPSSIPSSLPTSFPTALPTVTPPPSPEQTVSPAPSLAPLETPTALPTPSPTLLPTSPHPSPLPTLERFLRPCSAASPSVVDNMMACDALWSSPSSWMSGVIPGVSSLVAAEPPLEDASSCLSITQNISAVSKVVVKGSLQGGHMRLRVATGGQLIVHNTENITQDNSLCEFPTLTPTPFNSYAPSSVPSSSPTVLPSAAPSPSPTSAIQHSCAGVAWNEVSGRCYSWSMKEKWSTGEVPGLKDFAEIILPPLASSVCTIIDDVAIASEVVVSADRDSILEGSAKLVVRKGGRLVVSNTASIQSNDRCAYPTPSPTLVRHVPTVSPTLSRSPSSPSSRPTHAPTQLSVFRPSLSPSVVPSPLPTKMPLATPVDVFACGEVAVAYASSEECISWSNPSTWTSNVVPGIGAAIQAKAPPLPNSENTTVDGACVDITSKAFASKVSVETSTDGHPMQLRVRFNGRLSIKGEVSVQDLSDSSTTCFYPSPSPTNTASPSSPTASPSWSPTSLPSPVPTPLPSSLPTRLPSASPTSLRRAHTCGAKIPNAIDDSHSCDKVWSDINSWMDGSLPIRGDLVQAMSRIEGAESCLRVEDSNATASKMVVSKTPIMGSKTRLRVLRGGRIHIAGSVSADVSSDVQCVFPTLAPTMTYQPTSIPSSLPSMLPSPHPSIAPTSTLPTQVPSRPTVLPSPSPTSLPSALPTVAPSLGRLLHRCGNVALAALDIDSINGDGNSSEQCSLWNAGRIWNTGLPPQPGELVEVVSPFAGSRDTVCVVLDGPGHGAQVEVSTSADGANARLRVKGPGGKLVIRGTQASLQNSSDAECAYPSAAPTLTPVPSVPSMEPSHAPSTSPSTLLPSQVPSVSSTTLQPTLAETYDCQTWKLAVAGSNVASCDVWERASTWTTNAVPQLGSYVIVKTPTLSSSVDNSTKSSDACVAISGDAFVSKLEVKQSVSGGRVRVSVRTAYGRLVIKGKTTQDPASAECSYPTPGPSLSPAPTSPTVRPSHLPTSLPSSIPSSLPSPSPSLAPIPSPTEERPDVYECTSVTNAYAWIDDNAEAKCQSWMNPTTWTSNYVPSDGNLVQTKAPPLPSSRSNYISTVGSACVELWGDASTVARLSVKTSLDGHGMRLKVGSQGRLTVKGTASVVTESKKCAYPTPQPTLSLAPSAPSWEPSHVPTELPSAAPSLLPSAVPSAAPSSYRPTTGNYECAVTTLAVVANKCQPWNKNVSWSASAPPHEGQIANLYPYPGEENVCVFVGLSLRERFSSDSSSDDEVRDEAVASRVRLTKRYEDAGYARLRVRRGGRFTVKGAVDSTLNTDERCVYPFRTGDPSQVPSLEPTSLPSLVPSQSPTSQPARSVVIDPSSAPSPSPSSIPTPVPTPVPSLDPSGSPTFPPSPLPTLVPSLKPTQLPSLNPSPVPSRDPTPIPSSVPTLAPSPSPSSIPTPIPSSLPTLPPSPSPSPVPSLQPTSLPSTVPTPLPSSVPTHAPSSTPQPTAGTWLPTRAPTGVPTNNPTLSPTSAPSIAPTFVLPPGVNMTWPGVLTLSENGTDHLTFNMALTAEPVATVHVSISSPQSRLLFLPASIVFDYTNFNMTQSVRVSGVDNSIRDGDHADNIIVTASSSDDWWECDEALRTGCTRMARYNGIQVQSANLTVLDDDVVGVVVSAAQGLNATYNNFGDALTSAEYTLVLRSEPISSVTVNMSGLTAFASTVPSTVSFTASNWDVPVAVKVFAQAPVLRRPVCLKGKRFCDAIQNRSELVVHNVTSADPYYSNLAVDSASVSVTVKYDTVDPPEISIGRFVNLLNAIQVIFKFDTNRAELSGSFGCSRVLDVTTAEATYYFGYQHFCSFTSTSVLKITFGDTPHVLAGYSFALKDLTLRASAESSTLFATNETFAVQDPLLPTVPTTSLTASSEFVGLCDVLVLDGTGSWGSGGRDMAYEYSVQAVTGDVSNISYAFSVANAASGQRSITLDSSLMTAGSVFRVTLRTTNFIGYSHSMTVTIEKLGWPAPVLSVQGSTVQTTYHSSSFFLQVNAALPSFTCVDAGISGTKLSFSWDEATGHFNGQLSGTSKNPRILYIPAGTLEAGVNYTFIATGWMPNNPSLNNTASVIVEVAYQDLFAVIDDGVHRQVGKDTGFSLNGKMSYDPDGAAGDLSYAWRCNATSATASCSSIELLQAESINIASGALEVGEYVFTLTVSKGKRSSSTSTFIEILSGSPPKVEVTPLTSKKYNLDSGFIKVSSAPVVSSLPVTTTWSAPDTDVVDIFKLRGKIVNSIRNADMAVVQLSFLTEGFTYTLKLSAIDSAFVSSYATVTFTINEAPSSGSMTVAPLNGRALSTLFSLSAVNWVDDDLPMAYLFGTTKVDVSGSLTNVLTPFGDKRSDCFWNDVKLPQGAAVSNYTVGTFVEVIDSYGAVGKYTARTHVLPEDLTLDQLLNETRTQSTSALDTGTADTSRQVILACALGLKTSAGTNAGRRSLLGITSATEARAVLLEDLWATYELTETTTSEVASSLSVLDGIVETPSEISPEVLGGSFNFILTVLQDSLAASVVLSETAADYVGNSLESLFHTAVFNNTYDFGAVSLDHSANVSTILRLTSTALLIDAYDGVGYLMSGLSQEVELYSYRSSLENLGGYYVSLLGADSGDTITKVYFNKSFVSQVQDAESLNETSTLDVYIATIDTNILMYALRGSEGSAAAIASRADQADTTGVTLLRSDLTVVELALVNDPSPLASANLTEPIEVTLRANIQFTANLTDFDKLFACNVDQEVVTLDCPLAPLNHTCDFATNGNGEKYIVEFVCPYVAPVCLRWHTGARNFSDADCRVFPEYTESEVTCECNYQPTSTIFVLSGELVEAKTTVLQTAEPTLSPSLQPTSVPTHTPTPRPTQTPTASPSVSQLPTHRPTPMPSPIPSTVPSISSEPTPLTWTPSSAPTPTPTSGTPMPTSPFPTPMPSMAPTPEDTILVATKFNIVATKAPSEDKERILKETIAFGIGRMESEIKGFFTSVSSRRLLNDDKLNSGTNLTFRSDKKSDSAQFRELNTIVVWSVDFMVQSSTMDALTVSEALAFDLAEPYFTDAISSNIAGAAVNTSSLEVVVIWNPTPSPTPLPSPPPTPLPTQCLNKGLFCEATAAYCNVSYCESCPFAGLCDRTCKICLNLEPTSQPMALPSPAPSFLPTPRPTFSPTKSPTHIPTKFPTQLPTSYPSLVPTSSPSTYPTLDCGRPLALLRVDTHAHDGGTSWGNLNFSIFVCSNLSRAICNRDTEIFGGTLAPGSTSEAHFGCVGNSSCFAFALEGTKPAHSISWEIADMSIDAPKLFGTGESDETLFCLNNGALDKFPTPQPTTSFAPIPGPTALPTGLPTLPPSHMPFPVPTNEPSPVPSPKPTQIPTPLPTIHCDPGHFVNTAYQCEECAIGTSSNLTLPPFPKWECPRCSPGKVSKVTASLGCQDCVSGKFSSAARDSCGACGPGEFVFNASSCENCPMGHYAPVALNDECFICSSGSSTGEMSGAYLCTDCSGGRYAPTASMNCSLCEAGQYSGSRSPSCTNCSVGSYASEVGSSLCFDCSAGKHAAVSGTAECIVCEVGYQSSSRAQYCEACSVGTYTSSAGSEYCDSCAVGRVATSAGSTICQNCTVGRYQPAFGQGMCTGCAPGRFAETAGASVCAACLVGKVAPLWNSSLCEDCAAGQYQSAVAQTKCVPCKAGDFSPEDGSSTCTACPETTYSSTGSMECLLCAANYYLPNNEVNATCMDCPEGTACNQNGASTQSALQLEPDFWRVSENSVDILACPIPNSCKGDNGSLASLQNRKVFGEAYCETGYTGPLCGVCASGAYFEPVAYACVACEDAGVRTLFSSPAIIITIVVFLVILLSKFCFWVAHRHNHIKQRTLGKLALKEERKKLDRDDTLMSKEKKANEFQILKEKLKHHNDSMDVGADGTITFTKKLDMQTEPPSTVTTSTIVTAIAKIEKVEQKHRGLHKTVTKKTFLKHSNAILRTLSDLEHAAVQMRMLLSYGQVAVQLGFVLDIDFPKIYADVLDVFTFITLDLIPSLGFQCRIDGYDYIHRVLFTCAIPTVVTFFLGLAFLIARVKVQLKFKEERAEKRKGLNSLEKSIPDDLVDLFTPTELLDYKLVFMGFDINGNGAVDKNELKSIIMQLDFKISAKEAEKQVDVMFSVVCENGAEITFPEFLMVVEKSIHRSYGLDDEHVVASGQELAILAEKMNARRRKHAGSWIISSWLVLGFVFLVCTSSSLLHFLHCHTMKVPEVDGGGTESYLYQDYSVSCYGKRYSQYIPVVLLLVAIFPVGIPAVYGTLLFNQRRFYNNQQALDHEIAIGSPHVSHLTFLTLPYKIDFYYWELIETFRRLILGVVVAFLGFNTAFVGVFGLVICFFFIFLHVEFEPHKELADNKLGIVLAYSQALLFLVGLLIRTNAFDESVDSMIGIFLIVLFFAGPILIIGNRYSVQLNFFAESCRCNLIKFCSCFTSSKRKSTEGDELEVHEDASTRGSKLMQKLMAMKTSPNAKQAEEGAGKKRKQRRKLKRKKKIGLENNFGTLATLILRLGVNEDDEQVLDLEVDSLSQSATRNLVYSLDRPPQRQFSLQRRLKFWPRSDRLRVKNANYIASLDRPPSAFEQQQESSNLESPTDGFDTLADLILLLPEFNRGSDLMIQNQRLTVGDYVYWRYSDAELPERTLGRVEVLFPDDCVEVRFAPRGREEVQFTFSPDRLQHLDSSTLEDHWAHEKALALEAATQTKMQKTLAANYGYKGDVPLGICSAVSAADPMPHQMLEHLKDRHIEELEYRSEEVAFLAKFLMSIGCGPETGALACLEDFGVESVRDLRDPEIGAEQELGRLPAIGPEKAARIVELAIGMSIREFV